MQPKKNVDRNGWGGFSILLGYYGTKLCKSRPRTRAEGGRLEALVMPLSALKMLLADAMIKNLLRIKEVAEGHLVKSLISLLSAVRRCFRRFVFNLPIATNQAHYEYMYS